MSHPYLLAPKIFSLNPPTGNTLPVRVISPVIAMVGGKGSLTAKEIKDDVKEIPADGPSFGIAPSGQ